MTIFGEDSRVAVPDVTEAPFRHVCALRIVGSDGRIFNSTGALVGPRTVLTTADSLRSSVLRVEVGPAFDRDHAPYGVIVSKRFAFDQRSPDLGAILLDDDRFAAAGWFGMAAASDELLLASKLTICGYAGDVDGGKRQLSSTGNAREVAPDLLSYEIDTYVGQGGSPIWIDVEGHRLIVGVHRMGAGAGRKYNSGPRIDAATFAVINEWIGEH